MNNEVRSGLSRRSLLIAGATIPLFGGMASLLSGCASPSGEVVPGAPAELIKQVFMTPAGFTPSFVETYVASQQGYWKDHGVDIDVRGGQGAASALQATLSGSVQYGRGTPNALQAITNHGAEVIFFGQAYRQSSFALASLPGSPITSPEQLEGKTVGIVSAGGGTETALNTILFEGNVPESSVQKPVVGTGPAPYELAKGGKIDAWIAVETDLRALAAKGFEVHSDNVSKWVKTPDQAYFTTTKNLAENREAVVGFLAGILESVEFFRDENNFDAVFEATRHFSTTISRDALKVGLEVIVDTWTLNGLDRVGKLIPQDWEVGQEQGIKLGVLDKAVDLDLLIDTTVHDDALKMVAAGK